jgi:hypothetical protein
MCGSAPKPEPPPPPPAPPAPPAPIVPLQIAHAPQAQGQQTKGRSSLRIDRSAGSSSSEGAGLNLPQ